ncbi:MAG: hypothetical protein U5K00_17930 [Melioribacteraceae bacterium]|nr:hypothetical protein [Melioribacteraceae bacterium]
MPLDDVPTNYERSYVFQKADTLIYFYRPPTVAYINVEESYDYGETWTHKQKIEGFTFP